MPISGRPQLVGVLRQANPTIGRVFVCATHLPRLGELTDEVERDTYIKTFLSTGPKSYSYKLNTDATVRKIKGISFNYTNDAIIDFECMKRIVFGQETSVKLPQSNQISRVKHRGIVYNRSVSKTFRKIFDKRVIGVDTFNTLPYGY